MTGVSRTQPGINCAVCGKACKLTPSTPQAPGPNWYCKRCDAFTETDATDQGEAREKVAPCPSCGNPPGQKVGPPAMARCITDGCPGKNLAAVTLAEWNTRTSLPRCDDLSGLAEELREYTAMKYAGDCKCGKCQLVPRKLVERIYHTLNSASLRQSTPHSFDGAGELIASETWRQSDEVIRNTIAREIWRYQECEEAYGDFDKVSDATVGMGSLIKQTAIDQAEMIRGVLLNSSVFKACLAALSPPSVTEWDRNSDKKVPTPLNWQTMAKRDCWEALYEIGGALRRMGMPHKASRVEKIAGELYPGMIKPAPIVPRTTT